jgi:hypothetical protein
MVFTHCSPPDLVSEIKSGVLLTRPGSLARAPKVGPGEEGPVEDDPNGKQKWWQNPATIASIASLITAVAYLIGTFNGSSPT